jgi:hypothetical protein
MNHHRRNQVEVRTQQAQLSFTLLLEIDKTAIIDFKCVGNYTTERLPDINPGAALPSSKAFTLFRSKTEEKENY